VMGKDSRFLKESETEWTDDEIAQVGRWYAEAMAAAEKDIADQSGEPSVDEAATKYVLSQTDDHTHFVELDGSGSGKSTTEEGHSHAVVKHKVEKSDGHTHPLRKVESDESGEDGAASSE